MRWVPDCFLTYETLMAPDEAASRLASQVETRRYRRWCLDRRPFRGRVTENGFKIRPFSPWYACRPVLRGTFEARTTGTRIGVHVRLQRAEQVVLLVWLSWFGLIAQAGVYALRGSGDPTLLLIACAFLLTGYGLIVGGFWHGAGKAIETLDKIFT